MLSNIYVAHISLKISHLTKSIDLIMNLLTLSR